MPPLLTARIPELGPQSDLSLEDYLAVWQAATDLTKKVKIQDLRTLIVTGETLPLPPAFIAGTIIHDVTAGEAGGNIVSMPGIAGKNFLLRRGGVIQIPQEDPPIGTAQYEILSGGGFKMIPSTNTLIEGERFEIVLYTLAPIAGITSPTGFLLGTKLITANTTLDPVTEVNKLIQFRGNLTQLTLTLPDVDDVADNAIVVIETDLTNSVEHSITTTGGQFIYLRNGGKTTLYIRPGEVLWLYRKSDGWYVINSFSQIYDRVGTIQWVYKVGPNQIVADGSLVSRTTYKRLTEEVLTFGTSLLTEIVWQTSSVNLNGDPSRPIAYPYRGCWSTGDGTNIRVPDLRNMHIRGLKAMTGTDTERHLNKAGGYQDDQFKSHYHAVGTEVANNGIFHRIISLIARHWNVGNTDSASVSASTDLTGGPETRGENIGMIPVINV